MRLFIAISLKLGGLAEEFVRSFDIVPSREINACLKILLFSSPNFFLSCVYVCPVCYIEFNFGITVLFVLLSTFKPNFLRPMGAV